MAAETPPPAPTLVVSDAHLGAAPPEREAAFLDFLQSVPDRSRDLLIAGDLFDFWFEYRTVILRRHFPVLRILAGLVDAGVRIRFVGGNHDSWGGSFLRDEIGLELLDGPVVTDVGGRRAYVAHGDGLAGGDWGYRALRRVLRSRAARSVFRALHPDRTDRWIRRVSRTDERAGGEPDARSRERAERLEALAETLLRGREELRLVVFGHCHRPTLREVEPGRHYLNAGDWIHHCTWGEVAADRVRLRSWNPR